MHAVDYAHYMARVRAWQRVPQHLRKAVTSRDERGKPCKELWAHGKCFTRIVDVGGGYCRLFADRGQGTQPDQGKISFSTWLEHDQVFGDGRPHRMAMVPRDK